MELLTWAIIFIVISLIAGALGFTGLAGTARTIAKWLFIIFLVLALVLFLLVALGISLVV